MSRPITKAKGRLTSQVTAASTTISFQSTDSNRGLTSVAMADFGTYGYLTINPTGKVDNYEVVRFESWSVSGSIITIGTLTRNLELEGNDTAQTGREFPAGTTVIVSTNHNWFNNVVRTEDAQTVAGVKTFSSFPVTPNSAPTTDYQVANKKYADDLAIAGAPDASTTVKGIVEEATATEAAAGTATGGTGARLFLPAAIASNTSSAAQLVPITDADGDIPVEFMELDAAWTFTSTLDVNTATNFQLGGVAYTGAMADLNEASTFFQATDITGAQAETLSDGSNADSLHIHTYAEKGAISAGATTVTNTVTETSLLSYTLPADQLSTNNAVKIEIPVSSFATAVSAESITLRLKYGSTTVASTTLTMDSGGFPTAGSGTITAHLLANASVSAQNGLIRALITENGFGENALDTVTNSGVGTATENSGGALTLSVTAQWGNADASNTITVYNGLSTIIK